MRIGLIPLDERPVNTRYPAMIAEIAGVELLLPPPELLSCYRQPAPCDALGGWLRDHASGLDALIVSCEMLGYGGLIASRITSEATATIIERLDLLRVLKQQHPDLMILGFNLITRVSNANDAIEEPDYWAEYGQRMYRLSQLLDQAGQRLPVAEDLATLRATLPAAQIQDFLRRRARNHTVNLEVLQLVADGTLDLLVLSSDDTSPYGLPSREKRWLAEWAERLELGDRLLMYPGADEVGCALLARAINRWAGWTPHFQVCYAIAEGAELVAPYEDGPVRVTVERQVQAVGGTIREDNADLLLAINPPVPRRSEWHPAYAAQEQAERLPRLRDFVLMIRSALERGQPVIVADVAYPNGADPALLELLKEHLDLTKLAAYGAWNTAGNTIGTALAQGCAVRLAYTAARRQAQQRFLLHRLLEDWGYQQSVRAATRDWLEQTSGRREPTNESESATIAEIACQLQPLIERLPGFDGGRYQVANLRLPWRRTFEIDFDLHECAGVGR
jgi:hypothetical protein